MPWCARILEFHLTSADIFFEFVFYPNISTSKEKAPASLTLPFPPWNRTMEITESIPDIEDEMDATTALLTTYNELNSPTIDELNGAPSALEFMRFVAKNRPFVVRGGASDWEAVKTWNVGVLKGLLEKENVNVAITPRGYVQIFHI